MAHVTHIINDLGWGGAESLVRDVTRHLRRRRWRVTICALREPVHDAGGEAHCLRARGPWDIAGYLRLRALLGQLRPDVVHLHLLWAELWGAAAASATRAPAIITAHCTIDARERSCVARRCSRIAVRHTAATIAISHAVARYRVARCGDLPTRIRVIHNGVELVMPLTAACRQAVRAQVGLEAGAAVIGAVARLHPVKGLTTLVAAAALVARHHPQAQFLVVGGGPQERELREMASALGLDGRVVFTGQVSGARARELLAAMDIFVLPSLREGLGIAAIEAMAAALPVVASDCDGLAEVVDDGRTGLLFPRGDAVALADRLQALLHEPALARSLGQAGRRVACQRFALDQMVTKIEQVYHTAMARAKAGGRRLPVIAALPGSGGQ
jgi:glycosyltransferase involved in cell wall biosynthesis